MEDIKEVLALEEKLYKQFLVVRCVAEKISEESLTSLYKSVMREELSEMENLFGDLEEKICCMLCENDH